MNVEPLISAVESGDYARCERLLARVSPDTRNVALHKAVSMRRCDIVKLMLKYAVDPTIRCGQANAIQVCTFSLPSLFVNTDPFVLELILSARPDLQEGPDFKGCAYLMNGQLKRAATHFFGCEDVQPVYVFERYFEVAARLYSDLRQEELETLFLMLFRNQTSLGDQDCLQIASYLMEKTQFSYVFLSYFVTDVLRRPEAVSSNTMCDLADIICSSRIDRERYPFHLEIAVIDIMNYILDSDENVPRLACTIGGFDIKNDLLLNDRVLMGSNSRGTVASTAVALRHIRFLIEECGCDPNFKNQDGDHALNLVLRRCEALDDFRRRRVDAVTQILLDYGAHPCVRNAKGQQAFTLIPKCAGIRSLRCMAASIIEEAKIYYDGRLPKPIRRFVKLH